MKKQLHSNWRDDLREIVDISSSKPKTQTKSARRIEDKEVNNKVKINPVQQEEFDKIGGIILEVVELTEEEFINLVDSTIKDKYREDDTFARIYAIRDKKRIAAEGTAEMKGKK